MNKPFYYLMIFFHFPVIVFSQVEPADIFTNHAVLQENTSVPIWGNADPCEDITITFENQTQATTADENGKWLVRLSPMQASKKGRKLKITGKNNSIIFSDILVGQVWLCSGQSNMAVRLANAKNSQKVISKANHPNFRYFNVPISPSFEPESELEGQWSVCSPETAHNISAVSYFFAQKLVERLDKPVGVIISAWGGSTVQAWISKNSRQSDLLKTILPYDVTGHYLNMRPGFLFNGMISPLIPYSFKGVLWYQGESNTMDQFNPYLYRYLFKGMIKDWRNVWDHQKMPFYFVQLPNLHGGKDWPILRESQEIVYEELTNVEMATTIDIGESRKLHPQNKREVGKRLANLALGCEYRIPAHHKYPELKSVKKTGNTIIINIKNADGLKTTNGKLPANFKLADENGKFKPAKAKVVDSTIKVQSSDIAEPLYVRYAWGADPNVNVVNKYSLPLRPFRTDNFHVRNSDFLPKQLNSKAQLQQNFKPLEIAENQSNEWEYTGESFNEDIKPPVLKSYENGSVRLLTKENKSSPAIVWEKKINTPKNGLTFEIEARIWRANKPYQGLLLETGILKKDKVKVYRLEIKPLLIFAHQQKYISTLENMERPTRDCKSRHKLVKTYKRQGGVLLPIIADYYLAVTEPYTI